MSDDWVDFALAAYREEGVWQLQELAHEHVEDIDDLARALRRFPGDGGALGLISIDESYAVLLRVAGPQTQVLLSDVEAAEEFELAESILDFLGLPMPEEDDDPAPAGDLGILAHAGISAMDMGMMVEDDELYPDEFLSEIAHRLGFGDQFDRVADLDNE